MKETNIYHLLAQHQVLLFVVSAALLAALTILIVAVWSKLAEKRREREERENDIK